MLRPLAIGLPVILLIVAGFVAGMNLVPFSSPYFTYVIVGYVVLFPLALIWTIVSTIRSVGRVVRGGSAALAQTGRRATAMILSVSEGAMTVRFGGGPRMRMLKVRLRVEDPGAPSYETTVQRAAAYWQMEPQVGQRLTVYIDRRDRDNLYVDWQDSAIVAGSAAPGVTVQTVSMDGRALDLSQLSPQMADLVRMGMSMAERLKPMADSLRRGGNTIVNVTPQEIQAAPGGDPITASPEPQAVPMRSSVPVQEAVGPEGLEGRARIEGFRPYPDGTYDLDLYVTPRTRSSYRVAMRTAVPQEQMDRLAKGLTLSARIDPEIASRIELIWN